MMVVMAGQGDAGVTEWTPDFPDEPAGENGEDGAPGAGDGRDDRDDRDDREDRDGHEDRDDGARDAGGVLGSGIARGIAPDRLLRIVGDPAVDEVRLPNRPESAYAARRLAQAVLRLRWDVPPRPTDEAVLLVSELVGNAVRHTGAHVIGLRMARRRGWVRAEVRDPSRGLPCLLPVHPLDTTGRGLFLVDTLSDRWGVDLLPRGKTTWFEMRVGEG